jgi:hypothetical protein
VHAGRAIKRAGVPVKSRVAFLHENSQHQFTPASHLERAKMSVERSILEPAAGWMPAQFKLAVTIALVLVLGGCTSLKPVENWQTLHEGDKVRLTTTDGMKESLKLTAVTPTGLEGKVRFLNRQASIPSDEIVKVEGRHISGVKTTFLVGGTGVLVYAITFAVAMAALAASL